MPPVRWKPLIIVSVICLVQERLIYTDAQQQMPKFQEAISMTSDGWRPIVGTRTVPSYQEEIQFYRNPSQNTQTVKAEAVSTTTTTTTTPKPTQIQQSTVVYRATPLNFITHIQHGPMSLGKGKIPPHSKQPFSTQFFVLPNGGHGPHIPLGAVTHGRPGQNGFIKKHPGPNKAFVNGMKRPQKPPVRLQAVAHSNRQEIFVPAPTGSFAFFKQGLSNIKTRETQNLGLIGSNKHYTINQPHHHIDFNPFSTHSNNGPNIFQPFQDPIQAFIFPKPQHLNEIQPHFSSQNDDYTRNLVPPPPIYKNFQEKDGSVQTITKAKEVTPVTEVTRGVTELVLEKQPVVPENIIVQVPPPLEQQRFSFPAPPLKVHDVEITKAKLKEFHNGIPVNYNPQIDDYIDYDFHSIGRPSEAPKVPTYEVTEAKLLDQTPFFSRSPPPQPPRVILRHKKPTRFRPEVVELNLPPFLPTPYKPPVVETKPTSATQDEVSDIFTQLSKTMKHDTTTNPPFFDVKEVSTHYPILGRPEYLPVPEVTNDLTSVMPEIKTETATTTVAPLKHKPHHRRRRPLNRSRTTTEEASTESYELQKVEDNETDGSVETERPFRHRRPSKYRTTESVEVGEVHRYRTTTPMDEEITTKAIRNRSRNRYRQSSQETRGTSQETRGTIRKRTRPTTTEETPSNHHKYETATDVVPNHKTEYSSHRILEINKANSAETTEILPIVQHFTNAQRNHLFERPLENVEDSEENALKSLENDQKPQQSKDNLSTDEEEVENVTSRSHKSTTTEENTTTNLLIPENEPSTSIAAIEDKYAVKEDTNAVKEDTTAIKEDTTLATTTTTSTTTEASTTKVHRIRTRPPKYDTSHRPRFSVKEYRQRLNQQTSTSSTTENYRTSSESMRIRFPPRQRRPSLTTTASTSTEPTERSKFVPKESRYTTTGASETIITEKNVKAVNTRLRPFGRYRSTTENPTGSAGKVSIKPNLFANRRRPPVMTLRNRILSRNKTEERSTTTEKVTDSSLAVTESNSLSENDDVEDETEASTNDVLKNEAALQSQRVSDLTSSLNVYDNPSVFKSVPTSSRRIPNYFTISTEDPILPIEAFFPNLKEKEKTRE